MCGICGFAYADAARPAERAELEAMAQSLAHRGPDSAGYHVAAGVGLGFRRLSILDLATGDQPLANEDGTIWVICNGEIYNHVELRERLVAAGHRFRSRSDAEVIVHLYEEHGPAFVGHLRGMFAIALWDARTRTLLLVRDRLGIKPLHYALTADGLWFGSEQKAILAAAVLSPRADPQALRQLFTYGRVLGGRTLLAGVERLRAGCILTYRAGKASVSTYWDVRFPGRDEYERRSRQEWAVALHAKLAESVRVHLRSDVPVGAWLSAGIDSSAVTALMAQHAASPIATFTVRFEDPRFDELGHQKALDDYPAFGLAGHRLLCRKSELARLPRAIWHGEDNLISAVSVGQMLMAEATARHVKVVLTGEGADEALGGYSWYATSRVLAPAFMLPREVRRAVAGVSVVRARWPGAAGVLAGEAEMKFERYSRSVTHLVAQAAGQRVFAPELLAQLGGQDHTDDAAPLPAEFARWHPFAQMQYFDLKYRLADAVVLGLDRASMAYSVEARVPFLDHELVELCARIPPGVKMRGLREKDVLRRAMRDVLPAAIVQRKKHPMQVPMSDWLRGELPEFAEAALAPAALRAAGYFSPAKVAELRRQHAQEKGAWGQALAMVLGVQIWHQLFCAARVAAPSL